MPVVRLTGAIFPCWTVPQMLKFLALDRRDSANVFKERQLCNFPPDGPPKPQIWRSHDGSLRHKRSLSQAVSWVARSLVRRGVHRLEGEPACALCGATSFRWLGWRF